MRNSCGAWSLYGGRCHFHRREDDDGWHRAAHTADRHSNKEGIARLAHGGRRLLVRYTTTLLYTLRLTVTSLRHSLYYDTHSLSHTHKTHTHTHMCVCTTLLYYDTQVSSTSHTRYACDPLKLRVLPLRARRP